jgi:hypothetical protein
MNPRTEERLRAAFEAKADQVTEERLDRLAAQRQQSLLGGEDDWSGAGAPARRDAARPLAGARAGSGRRRRGRRRSHRGLERGP